MSEDFEVLKAEALRLSPADREDLLDLLVASLEADPGAAVEWDAIADVRERELRSGVVQAVRLEDVMARLEAQFPDEGRPSSLG